MTHHTLIDSIIGGVFLVLAILVWGWLMLKVL